MISIINRGLAKLTIHACKHRENQRKVGSIQAMYNPAGIHLEYQNTYLPDESIDERTSQTNRYINSLPSGLTLDLLFDSTLPDNTTPVSQQIALLTDLCAMNPSDKEPHFLMVQWGKMRWNNEGYFAGRADRLSINYTLFDRDGTPLRAQVNLHLVADASLVIQETRQKLAAPPKAAIRVPDLSPLPLMAASMAALLATEMDYLTLAWQNNLNHLHDFKPGQLLSAQTEETSR